MDVLQISFSYLKNTRQDIFEVLILNLLPSVVENSHPTTTTLMLLTLGLGTGDRLWAMVNKCESTYTGKPALLYLCHCNDMFWPVCWSMKDEIQM